LVKQYISQSILEFKLFLWESYKDVAFPFFWRKMLNIHENVRSKMAAIVIGFDAGARAEKDIYPEGIAHMLEHMMFKGTEKRSCYRIPKEISLLGGSTNAYTSNEMVVYYISVPYENIEKAAEILSDMTLGSTFPEKEFWKEKKVVLEEEAATHEDINDFLWNSFSKNFFRGRLSSPVIGSKESIESFTREDLFSFYGDYYNCSNGIVSICADIEEERGLSLLQKYFGDNNEFTTKELDSADPFVGGGEAFLSRPLLEHSHFWECYPSPAHGEKNLAAYSVMLSVLGGGMGSRLFESARERRGLCYSIYASNLSNRDSGALIISSSTKNEQIAELSSVIQDEINRMRQELITAEELERAKNVFRAGTYRLLEKSDGLALFNLKKAFFQTDGISELSKKVAALTREDILNVAQESFDESSKFRLIVEPER